MKDVLHCKKEKEEEEEKKGITLFLRLYNMIKVLC